MLSYKEIARLSDEITEYYSQLEHDVILKMVEHLSEAKIDTDAVDYLANIMKETTGLKSDVNKILKKYNKNADPKIVKLFNEAMKRNKVQDAKRFQKMSGKQKQILSTSMERFLNADLINKDYKAMAEKYSADKLFTSIRRMTLTIADTCQSRFIQECNRQYIAVSSGALSYQDALEKSVSNLVDNGVRIVTYSQKGERAFTVEAAMRMNILTGINQSASQQTLDNCAELGVSLVEVTAHEGARHTDKPQNPWSNHDDWQGKIYSLNGGEYYTDAEGKEHWAEDFESVCGLGYADGICGINCRHSYYPYIEGTEPLYTDSDLEDLAETSVDYDNEELSLYEAEQKMRGMERNVRKYKDLADAQKVAGLDNSKARELLGKWKTRLDDFSEQTGISRSYSREYVATKNDIRAIYSKAR